jgi:beta-glucosidase
MMAGLAAAASLPARAVAATPAAGGPMRPSDPAIKALIGEMTLDEKLGQLTMVSANLTRTGPYSPPVALEQVKRGWVGSYLNLWGVERVREAQQLAVEGSRLGIPLFFGFDVLHGQRTIFPIPLAEACAFDPALWERTARAAAEEAAAEGIDLTFAPMLDVTRDPRWGRVAEGPGEDAYLASRFAKAKVRGFQSPDLSAADAIAATAKHLGGYGAVGAGREYAPVDISERQLHEVYLPAFAAAIEADVAAIMPAFTDLAGVPMTANAAILSDLVRFRWGFAGVMISDYKAIVELIAHGVAGDLGDAAALALKAGVDIDMLGEAYPAGLPLALKRGQVTLEAIDASVERVLMLKKKLGLFEDPYRRCGVPQASIAVDSTRRRRVLAREAACRSIVLLKNAGQLLPLADSGRSIALIGPLADAGSEMLGPWAGDGRAQEVVTVRAGLRDALPGVTIACASGCGIEESDAAAKASAVELAGRSETVILCLGERRTMSGEAASRARPGLPPPQLELAQAIAGLGKPLIVLLFSGRPLILPDWLVDRASALLALWFLGSEAGNAVGDVLSGRFNPTGRLSMSWPIAVGQIPIFFGQRASGRPASAAEHYSSKYIDVPVEPRFAFGHGLSYGRFELSGLRVDRSKLGAGEYARVEVDIVNTGALYGEETILLFIRDPVASVARPLLELKGFDKVALASGERKTVGFSLAAEELRFLGSDLAPRLEAGAIEIRVGKSAARDALLTTRIELVA